MMRHAILEATPRQAEGATIHPVPDIPRRSHALRPQEAILDQLPPRRSCADLRGPVASHRPCLSWLTGRSIELPDKAFVPETMKLHLASLYLFDRLAV